MSDMLHRLTSETFPSLVIKAASLHFSLHLLQLIFCPSLKERASALSCAATEIASLAPFSLLPSCACTILTHVKMPISEDCEGH